MVEHEHRTPALGQDHADSRPPLEPDDKVFLGDYAAFFERTGPLTVKEQVQFSTMWMHTCKAARKCERDMADNVAPSERRFQRELEQRNFVRKLTFRLEKQVLRLLHASTNRQSTQRLETFLARLNQIQYHTLHNDFDRNAEGLEVATEAERTTVSDSEDEIVFIEQLSHSASPAAEADAASWASASTTSTKLSPTVREFETDSFAPDPANANGGTRQESPEQPLNSKRKRQAKSLQYASQIKRKTHVTRSGISDRLSGDMRTKVERALTALEKPSDNPFHEVHLYSTHGLVPPENTQHGIKFALDEFSLYDSGQMVDLLRIDNLVKAHQGQYELHGIANLYWDPEEATDEALDSTNIAIGWKRVIVSGFDIVRLKPETDALWIETRYTNYRLLRPADGYDRYVERARLFLNYFAFCRSRHVRGQMRAGPAVTVEQFNRALAAEDAQDSTNDLGPAWDMGSRALKELDADARYKLAYMLHKYLPDTPFVTPVVYDLVAPFLRQGTVRTFENHDPNEAVHRRDRDEKALKWYHAVVDSLAGFTMTVGATIAGRQMENTLPFGTGRKIEVYHEARIRGTWFKAGDFILVAGSYGEPHEVERESAVKTPLDDVEAFPRVGMPVPPVDSMREKANSPQPWFGRIIYFYRTIKKNAGRGPLQVHITWFLHRRSSPLSNVASPRALAYVDHCETVTATAIAAKIDIARVDVGQKPPEEGLYFDYYWDKTDGSWRDFATLMDGKNFSACDQYHVPQCVGCERRQKEFVASQVDPEPTKGEEQARVPHPVWIEENKSFLYDDDVYHVGDYVYVSPPAPDKSRQWRQPFRLARLISLNTGDEEPLDRETYMTVRWLFRRDDLFTDPSRQRDSLRIVATDFENSKVEVQELRGTFNVRHWHVVLEESKAEVRCNDLRANECADVALVWLSRQKDTFHCSERIFGDANGIAWYPEHGDPPTKPMKSSELDDVLGTFSVYDSASYIPQCVACTKADDKKRQEETKVMATMPKLRGLSLYAGADLYGSGLEQGSSVLETVAGVEVDPIACAVNRANRHGTVFNETVSDFLERALKGGEADKDQPSRPGPDEVDMIYAGCPCQGFSMINRAKKADDLRCAEPWVFLSCMDHWRPLFASFENVREIQRFVLPVDGAPLLLSLLIECLLELGYQVRPAVLQAAHYGAPQSRRRLILTIARRGLPLPEAPQPTHAFTDFFASLDPTTYDGFRKVRPQTIRHRDGHAANPANTFQDAASDLPVFGYQDPFNDADQVDQDGLQRWQPFVGIGYGAKEAYVCPPMSQLQRESRFELRQDSKSGQWHVVQSVGCDDQVVPSVSAHRASQLAHIKPRSSVEGTHNHEDIPESIETRLGRFTLRPPIPPALQHKQYDLWFSRLEWQDVISPLRTSIPVDGTSHGRRIHPESARQISIREAARCQGFSDLDSWSSCDADDVTLAAAYRMIGNAVPRPIGAALGRCLQNSLVGIVKERQEAGQDTEHVWDDLRRELELVELPLPHDEVISGTGIGEESRSSRQASIISSSSTSSLEILEFQSAQ
ncbi:hypothetical protein OIV83_003136 [Microbotryomycetes sp. JL201]|nr:hypothetical protein OIV83_003136 [Microbotryomycetes sp. JL201]